MLLPVILWLFSGGSAEVVNDFTSCGDFFRNGITPTILDRPQYKLICQTLHGIPYYATLYDTFNKIPVFSAYTFTRKLQCRRPTKWYIEPQLESRNLNPNMIVMEGILFPNQASNTDYEGSGFDRGHLAPVSQANSQGCVKASFTLTNAAPQYSEFNRGQWNRVERNMVTTMTTNCKNNPAYIVTGVVPGNIYMNNRVNVPRYFWTAYCCQTDFGLISGAVIGVNSWENQQPYPMTVTQLERQLAFDYNAWAFTLFDNNCRYANYVPVIN